MKLLNGQRWVWLALLVVYFAVAPTSHAQTWWRKGALQAPKGFRVRRYATVDFARSMTSVKVDGATILYVGSRQGWGDTISDVWAVVDSNSDGTVDYVHKLVVDGFNTPNGIALQGSSLFVATYEDKVEGVDNITPKGLIWRLDNVHQYALQKKTYKKNTTDITVVTDALPGDRWHGWRYIKFNGTDQLLVTIGIPCNVCDEDVPSTLPDADPTNPRDGGTSKFRYGTIYRLDVSKASAAPKIVATGVRNSVGLEHHPDTKELYFTDNGRDEMGENKPDCKLNRLTKEGQDFGIPYCDFVGIGGPWRRNPGPGRTWNDETLNINGTAKNCTQEVVEGRITAPVQAMGPHVAPLGLRFYRWTKDLTAGFPQSWDRTLLIVQRGSWNRKQPIAQRVMSLRVDGKTGAPSEYKPFVTGWLKINATSASADSWGRPADIEQLPDGSMVVSDDTSGQIFRITYEGKR